MTGRAVINGELDLAMVNVAGSMPEFVSCLVVMRRSKSLGTFVRIWFSHPGSATTDHQRLFFDRSTMPDSDSLDFGAMINVPRYIIVTSSLSRDEQIKASMLRVFPSPMSYYC
jgi:hypothetical protein